MAAGNGEGGAVDALQLRRRLDDARAGETLALLAEAAVRLRETGLLELLVVLAENYEDLVEQLSTREAAAAGSLAAAALRGLGRGEAWKAAPTVEKALACTVEALEPGKLEAVPPIGGLVSLLRSLGDPDVAKGLGILVHLARSLGRCFRSASENGGTGEGGAGSRESGGDRG